nr:DUF202 domain-containing protein [Pseudomonas taiwanensis]
MNPDHRHRTWERWLLGQGKPPDPRFTLANERTFLAWIRTALALLGGAIAIETFAAHAWPQPGRVAMEMALLAASLLVSLGAGWRWLALVNGGTRTALRSAIAVTSAGTAAEHRMRAGQHCAGRGVVGALAWLIAVSTRDCRQNARCWPGGVPKSHCC